MATSYKIRLRRFNGLDYDTLNLLSENIIRNNGNTVEQEFNNIIPSSNGMLKNNNGIFDVATLGTDYTAVDDSLTSSVTKTYSITKQKDTFAPFDMLGIIIDGNSSPVSAAVGQYVIVKNSTISGITDGLYTAALAIPANTAIDATYLSNKIGMGGLNDVIAVSSTAVSGARVVRSNKLVNLQFNVSASGTGWITVASGLPKQIGDNYYFFPAYDSTAGVSTMGRLYNGELALEAASSTGTSHNFRGSTTYFTND